MEYSYYEAVSKYSSYKRHNCEQTTQLSIMTVCFNQVVSIFEGKYLIYGNDSSAVYQEKIQSFIQFLHSIKKLDIKQQAKAQQILEQYEKNKAVHVSHASPIAS